MKAIAVKKIISAIDRLDAAGKAAVRQHLNGQGAGSQQQAGGKRLTRRSGNGYNSPMSMTAKPPKSTPNGVGKRIAERREAKGLSQMALAREVGISRIHISRLENGHSIPNTPTLRCLAEALDMTSSELLGGV